MGTKGASNHYGNAKHGKQGHKTIHTGFAWAKGFNKSTLERHFEEHGKEFGFTTKEQYAAHSVHFANTVDRDNCKSVVDNKGTTYKYNQSTNVLAEITNDGYVISYRHYGKSFWYYNKEGEKIWIK